jgi:predicted MFS family arabinose efflux permease
MRVRARPRAWSEGVWANPPLLRLQLSTAATSLGKWAFGVTLYVYAFRHGGTAAIGILALVQAVPATLAAPVLGLAGDRHPRQRVLLVTNAIRAVLLVLIALAAARAMPTWTIFLLAAAFSTISTANQPARAALIPTLARSPREVSSATSVMSGIDTTSFLLGAGLGGVLLGSTSVAFVIALCAIAYAAATALILAIPVDRHPARRRREPPLRALAAGFRTVSGNRELRLVVGLVALLSTIDGLENVFVVVGAIHLLHLGTAGVGYLNMARGAGGLLGTLAAFALLDRARLLAALAGGSVALGVPILLLGIFPAVGLALAAWCGFGLGYVLVKACGVTLVQRLSGDRVLARVFAVLETTFVATIGLGAVLAHVMESLLTLRGALVATGAALPLAMALGWSSLRTLGIGSPVSEDKFDLLRHSPIFEPLPMATVEELARRAKELDVTAGTDVITQGDVGESFYLIADGAVEVHENGILRRRQGPGESFGEIALLRDVPRTATVRAIEATKLLALDREPFLISVTGYADSHEAAHEVAQGFLDGTASVDEALRGVD